MANIECDICETLFDQDGNIGETCEMCCKDTLSRLQDIRERGLGDRYSPVFTWAINIAISELIGISAEQTIRSDLVRLMEALHKQLTKDRRLAA